MGLHEGGEDMYKVSSGHVGRGPMLQFPDISPASVAGIFRGGRQSLNQHEAKIGLEKVTIQKWVVK